MTSELIKALQEIADKNYNVAAQIQNDNYNIAINALQQKELTQEEVERVARAIYYSDPNFEGWGAIEKKEIYWQEETNKKQWYKEAKAAIQALTNNPD